MTIYTNNINADQTYCSFPTTDSLVSNINYTFGTFVGNIIPREWYQKFTNNRGTPDLSLISILSEIIYWYRPKKVKDKSTNEITYVNKFLGDAWQSSYEYFEKKFGFNREKIRRVFVKLEESGICTREFRTVHVRGQRYNNRLFIHLNSGFLECNTNKKVSDENNIDTASNPNFSLPKIEGGSPHLEGDHIIDTKNKNINKDRSMKSNFLQNSFLKKGQGSIQNQYPVKPAPIQIKAPIQQLKDFYPMSQSDADNLQSLSGREFSLNAMNEILLDMSKRVKDRWFKSKKGFLSYMSLVFKHEMRDAVKVNNTGFKIKTNQTIAEMLVKKQEEFLSQIEYSRHVSPEWHLKKKLCSVLDREKAYILLSNYKHCIVKGDAFEIHLTKQIELTSLEQNIILSQAKASHESFDLSTGKYVSISSLKIITPAHSLQKDLPSIEQGRAFPPGIWGSIRQALISYYGKEGESLDKAWFSRLTPEVDENTKTIKLKAPKEFFKDWISRNYTLVLDSYFAKYQYSYQIC